MLYNVWVIDSRVTDDAGNNRMAAELLFPDGSIAWSDMSEQVDVPIEPNVIVAYGQGLTAEQYDALALAYGDAVLESEGYDG